MGLTLGKIKTALESFEKLPEKIEAGIDKSFQKRQEAIEQALSRYRESIESSALSKTDPPVLSKSDPGILTEPRPPRLRDDDESSRCQRPGRDHARSAAGGSDRIRG
jgi:DNA-binding transcriptional MerR regulator